jgi:hypothetical protein
MPIARAIIQAHSFAANSVSDFVSVSFKTKGGKLALELPPFEMAKCV